MVPLPQGQALLPRAGAPANGDQGESDDEELWTNKLPNAIDAPDYSTISVPRKQRERVWPLGYMEMANFMSKIDNNKSRGFNYMMGS